VKLAELL